MIKISNVFKKYIFAYKIELTLKLIYKKANDKCLILR